MFQAAARIEKHPQVASSTAWEDLQVDGQSIVNEVEEAIERCSIGIFEVSTLNNNVLFELGLAIGKGKRVLILRESQDKEIERRWRSFSLLTTTGYTGYTHVQELVNKISAAIQTPQPPLLDDLFRDLADYYDDKRLIYFPSMKLDEPSRQLSRLLQRYNKLDTVTIDLDEYGSGQLAWFAEQIYTARTAVFHLTPSTAPLADSFNPQISFLAGLARGLGREIVLVHEKAQVAALDYRDLEISYSSTRQLKANFSQWIESLRDSNDSGGKRVRKHLPSELSTLQFGSHVAESDIDGLENYFVETRDYLDVIDFNTTIFTGRKGTGKTANMVRAAEQLRSDARNLVCVVKPASYEIEGLVAVLQRIDSRYLADFLIEGLWRYLIYTEAARKAIEEADSLPAGIAEGSPTYLLAQCLEEKHGGADASFSVRLERLVNSLEGLFAPNFDDASLESAQQAISKALYGTTLRELRRLLGAALNDRQRVAILIDNLDKAWERGSDLEILARLLLGLLTAVDRITDEFRREDGTKQRVNVTLTIFLRSDIYDFVRDRAPEPDKIPTSELVWRDPDMLARILEERFIFGRKGNSTAQDLWNNYFTSYARGMKSKDYILSRLQPRPRDLLVFANAAVTRAVNAKHHIIDEHDIIEAEKSYSEFAYEALLVEGIAAGIDFEPVLLEFAGEKPIMEGSRVKELIGLNVTDELPVDRVITILRRHGFLGIEISPDVFDYNGTDSTLRRADVRARKLEKVSGRQARYEIHPAYRAHLEIDETG